MATSGESEDSLELLGGACQVALEEYIQELRVTTRLLMSAHKSDSDMKEFLTQQKRERAAFKRYQGVRRRYDKVQSAQRGSSARMSTK